MRTESTAYINSTIKAFMAIDLGEHKEKIQFVDTNWQSVKTLPELEYAQVMDYYAEALFATSKFHRHIEIADHLVELSITHNIRQVNGRDLFYECLFKKAASLYNLERLTEATHILEELLRIDDSHESTRLFLINCYVKAQSPKLRKVRNASVVIIISSAVVIALELLVVKTFWPEYGAEVERLRNVMFISGVSLLAIGEIFIRYRAVSKMFKVRSR